MDEPIHVVREEEVRAQGSRTGAWLAAGIVVLVIALGVTVGYIYQQQNNTKALASHDSEMNATISQMQDRIDSLTAKLSQPAPAPAATASQPSGTAASPRRSSGESKRLKQMQATLADEQQQLKDTQDQLTQARSDFQAGLDSTRSDLNGSIARTHDELVTLEQRGERNYFEFDLAKAKHFQKEGPLMVSLRRADSKHKRYDLALVVDDNQLSKKSVNLYEPVWVYGANREQVQLVVNRIDKDRIHGYVSAPKYSESASVTNVSASPGDTASTPAASGTTTPSSSTSSSSSTTSSSSTPEQPQQ